MLHEPFYDPEKSYEENFKDGPFGAFADAEIIETPGEPRFDFFGYKVNSPFGIPAGPLINGKFVEGALRKGFDIVTYKTVRTRRYPCHPWPNVLSVDIPDKLTLKMAEGRLVADHRYHQPLSITNSFGVPSPEPDFWKKDMAEVVKKAGKGQVVVGGFQGTKEGGGDVASYINDFRTAARMIKETGAHVMEVNLSCPNEGTAHLLCFDIERSAVIAQAIKEEVGTIPLIVKIAYYPDEEELRSFVRMLGPIVDGISAINTIAAEIVDKEGKQALPGEGRLRSGVCGHSIKWAGVEMVGRLKRFREELGLGFTIIGVGGVNTVEDFQEYRSAGADIVMSATGAMWNPYLAKQIKETL